MEVLIVRKTEYDAMHISEDGYLSLLGVEGIKEDVKLPENEVGAKIREMLEEGKNVTVTILAGMGMELAVDAKVGAED